MNGLPLRADGAFDLVSLGALVQRLDPGVVPFRKATDYRVHVSGGEFNVAANLADCFGQKTAVVSAMVEYPLGQLIDERVRAMGVTPFYKRFAHDGVRGPNMATVYSDRGQGARPPIVFYNRANEAAAELRPGDFDWTAIFAGGVRWFHSGGIFAALSEGTSELILEGMRAAKAAGAVTSFDLNYREKLWRVRGGAPQAGEVLARIAALSDVLIGLPASNEADDRALREALGLAGPEMRAASPLDPAPFLALVERARGVFPNVKLVATTLRDVQSSNRHAWSAVARLGGETASAPLLELDVLDRVGSGDGFTSGLIYGLLCGESLEGSVRLGWAHGALVTTTPGDTTMVKLADVRAFAAGTSARIQR